MATNYPSGLDTYFDKDNSDDVLAAYINDLQDAIVALETELGTAPSGSESTVKARIEAIETAEAIAIGRTRYLQIQTVAGGSSPPQADTLSGTAVSTPVMWFAAGSDNDICFAVAVPPDCDPDDGLVVVLEATAEEAGATGECVRLQLDYACIGHNESITAASEYADAATVDVAAWGAEYRYRVADLAIDGAYLAAGDTVHCTLSRDTSHADDDYAHNFGVLHVSIAYTNKNPAT